MSNQPVSLEMVKKAGQLLKQEHEARLGLEKKAQATELEKRAMKVAFREVELGLAQPFTTYEAFMEKVASLANENLDVIEKAIELGYVPGGANVGTLAEEHRKTAGANALHNWVMNGELE